MCQCLEGEQDAFHITTDCALVNEDLREGILERLLVGNDARDESDLIQDNLTLLNCSRDNIFIKKAIEIIESNSIKFRKKIVLKK